MSAAGTLARTLLRRGLARCGLGIHRLHDAVAVPRPQPGPATFACPGIDWNGERALRVAREVLPTHREVWSAWPRRAEAALGYHTDNPFFGLVDAAVAYSLVRDRRPARVVEIGGGHSTRVLRTALGDSGELITIDPEPRLPVAALADRHLAQPVQAVAADWFAELPADSVLFIDSSHRGGTGSDVHHLFLEVLPRLRPGVLVHVHDVYLPDDYPTSWNLDRGFLYDEQYYLQALLADSRGFEIVWPGRWAKRNLGDALAALFSPEDLARHCSFWMMRR